MVFKFSWLHVDRFHHYHAILAHYIWSSWQSMDEKNYTCSCFFHVIWFLYPNLCDKVCQWLTTGQWFSPGNLVNSTNKTDRHDITKILLKVLLNTINERNGRTLIFLFWTVSVLSTLHPLIMNVYINVLSTLHPLIMNVHINFSFVYPSSTDHECPY